MKYFWSGLFVLSLFFAQSAFAQFEGSTYDGTYYDATTDNTAATDGTSPWYFIDGTDTAVNTLWRVRTAFGQGIFEADGSGNDAAFYGDKPEIYTTISGLVPGMSYDVDVIFWSSDSGSWRVRAGLASGELTEFLEDTNIATGGTQSDRTEYAGSVGVAVADANGEIKVYIDDNDPAVADDDQSQRTWYDGLAYKMVSPAYDPEPAVGDTGVDPATSFSWVAGRDLAGTTIHSGISSHYIYYSADEPNFVTPILVTDLSADRIEYTPAVELMANTTYYWRVDTALNGADSADDPNCLTGTIWSFETVKTLPSFDLGQQPSDIYGEAGQAYTLTALAVVESGTSEIFYQWYKGEVGSGVELTGETANTLDVTLSLDGSADGFYFCTATNDNENYIDSAAAFVQTKRQIGDLTFDNTLTDSVGGGGVTLAGAVYSTDVPYDESAASLSFDGATAATIDGGYMLTKDMTISVWFKYTASTTWQRIYDFGNGTGEYIFLSPSNGSQMRFAIKTLAVGSEQGILGTAPATGVWNHVVVTMTGDTGVMYLNGLPVGENTAMTSDPMEVDCSVSYLGDSQWEGDPYLTGMIDDLEVFNYGMTALEVADMYTSALNTYICIEEVQYDIAGPAGPGDADCKVDMLDFAAFAVEWLECGLYPASACN